MLWRLQDKANRCTEKTHSQLTDENKLLKSDVLTAYRNIQTMQDARVKESRTARAQAAFNRNSNKLVENKLIWSIAFYGAKILTLRKVDEKHLKSFETTGDFINIFIPHQLTSHISNSHKIRPHCNNKRT